MPVQQLESMTQQCPPESIYVLGVRVDRLSQQQALDRIEQIITQRRAGGNVGPCQQVVTLNTEFVMAAQRHLAFRRTINEAALVLPDGIGVVWATHYLGSPAPDEEDAIIERIKTARADVLCVAYGAPAQDLWIRRNLSRLPVAVAMGVGGAYDFLSGRQRRAPRIMQRTGLEWLYRLYRQPWRWRRMTAIPQFLVLLGLRGRKQNHV